MSGKRGKGEGSVRRLPSGSWQSQIMDGYTDEGKRHIVCFTAPTRAEALDKMKEYLLHKEENATDATAKIPLFADYAQNWYIAYRTQVEESTYAGYRYTLNILNKAFGSLPLCDIKVVQVNRFINTLASEGYSASQISKCRSMLIQILDVAEADDLVLKNYARRAFRTTKQLSKDKTAHTKDSFSVKETERLLSDLPNNLLGNSIRLMLVSGLRLQELLALTPNDIASDGSWVRVDKAVKMVDGIPKLGDPKSRTSRRIVPIAPKYRYIPRWLRENGGQAFLWCAPHQKSLLYIFGPTEIENAILPLLPQAGIDSAILPRTSKQGTVTQQRITLDCRTVWEDAQYVAKNYCGASDVMLHAMFGQAWTETDEHAYLDLLSDEYAVARWVYLRRFSPFNYTNSKAPICMQNDDASISFSSPETSIGRYVIHVQNTTNAPQLLKFSADYGIMVNWKEAIS